MNEDYFYDSVEIATTIMEEEREDSEKGFIYEMAKHLLIGMILYSKKEKQELNLNDSIKKLYAGITTDENFLKRICDELNSKHEAYEYFERASTIKGNLKDSILALLGIKLANI